MQTLSVAHCPQLLARCVVIVFWRQTIISVLVCVVLATSETILKSELCLRNFIEWEKIFTFYSLYHWNVIMVTFHLSIFCRFYVWIKRRYKGLWNIYGWIKICGYSVDIKNKLIFFGISPNDTIILKFI